VKIAADLSMGISMGVAQPAVRKGSSLPFPGPTGLYDALLVWSRINSVPVSELMPDL